MSSENSLIEDIVSLSKRKGFVFQSSEIYGGLNGFFDYGPLGVELRKNIKDAWWRIWFVGGMMSWDLTLPL